MPSSKRSAPGKTGAQMGVAQEKSPAKRRKTAKPSVAYDPIDVHIGQNLRVLRKAQQLSLEDLGRQLRVTYQQIQKYETGHNRVSASTLYRLTEVLGCKVDDLFKGLEGISGLNGHTNPSKDDLAAASALTRIEAPVVHHAMSMLITALSKSSH